MLEPESAIAAYQIERKVYQSIKLTHRSISYGKPGISKAIIDKQESIVYVHNLNPG